MALQVISRAAEPTKAGTFVPVLILSITLDPEYRSVEELLPEFARKNPRSETDKLLEIDRWILRRNDRKTMEIATGYINGMGNVRTALETSIYLERVSPRYIFLCGIAGSLEPKQIGLGDVVIGKTVDWWNLNKVQPDETCKDDARYLPIGDSYFRKDITSMGEHASGWHKRLSRFQNLNRERLPSNESELLDLKSAIADSENLRSNQIHYGKIVSWEYVLSHGRLRDDLRRLTVDGLAVEMEGAGFYSSIKRRNEELEVQQKQTNRSMGTKVEGFIFRGISDLSHKKGTEAEDWRKIGGRLRCTMPPQRW
jgi:nucleoside phosphorylase